MYPVISDWFVVVATLDGERWPFASSATMAEYVRRQPCYAKYRTANDDYTMECSYIEGLLPARYPVPSIYCSTLIAKVCDERSNEISTTAMLFDMI